MAHIFGLFLFTLTLVITVTLSAIPASYRTSHRHSRFLHNDHQRLMVDPGDPLILTPYIKAGDITTAQKRSEVHLDGFPNLKSYSGYFTVDEGYDSNLFFWFFLSDNNYKADPVILWLQGGPGASSLDGLFEENGPLMFESGQQPVLRTKGSWTKNHSVIYIDNPVGTGYSFTNRKGYCQNETIIGEHLYKALYQFFQLFPDLQKNDFFITGESYAGKYVPAVSYTILKKNPDAEMKINLKGLAIGDGATDPEHMLNYSDYLYQLGLIDSNQMQIWKAYEDVAAKHIQNKRWNEAFHIFDIMVNGDITPYPTLFNNHTGLSNYMNYLERADYSTVDNLMESYLTKNETRLALHVGSTPFGDDAIETELLEDFMQSVAPWLSELLDNYRVLTYNGQLDIILAYPLTVNYLQHLNFSSADEYKTAPRYPWFVGNDVAGYSKTAGGLTEVLVRDAGHMVPQDQPEWAQDLIYKFTRNIPIR